MASNDHDLGQQKLRLEIEKLAAEVKQIEAQLRPKQDRAAKLKQYIGVLVVIVTLFAGGWGLYTGASTFLDQRERQYEFNVSKELIELSRQLASEDRIMSANAAILLSAFEVHAVPILVENLSVTDNESFHANIRDSLALIMKKKRIVEDPDLVLLPVTDEMEFVFEEQARRPGPSLDVILNYVQTLAVLAKGSEHNVILDVICRMQKKVKEQSTTLDKGQTSTLLKALRKSIVAISKNDEYSCS